MLDEGAQHHHAEREPDAFLDVLLDLGDGPRGVKVGHGDNHVIAAALAAAVGGRLPLLLDLCVLRRVRLQVHSVAEGILGLHAHEGLRGGGLAEEVCHGRGTERLHTEHHQQQPVARVGSAVGARHLHEVIERVLGGDLDELVLVLVEEQGVEDGLLGGVVGRRLGRADVVELADLRLALQHLDGVRLVGGLEGHRAHDVEPAEGALEAGDARVEERLPGGARLLVADAVLGHLKAGAGLRRCPGDRAGESRGRLAAHHRHVV